MEPLAMPSFIAAGVSALAAVASAIFALRANAHEKEANAHSRKAHGDLLEIERLKIELEKQWRLEDREESERRHQEEVERQARMASEERIERFINCMTRRNTNGIAISLECGLAALESDEEIRRANNAYKARTGQSVFFGYEHYFANRDAKVSLLKWQTMNEKEKQLAGGLDGFLTDWPTQS